MKNTLVKPIDSLTRLDRDNFISSLSPQVVNGHSIPSLDIARQIISLVSPDKTANVLIVGSGSGYLPALFSFFSGQVIAIDKNRNMVQTAKKRFEQLSIENIELLTGNIEKVVLPKVQFDTILVCASKVRDKTNLFRQLNDEGELIALEEREDGLVTLCKYSGAPGEGFQKKEIGLLDFSTSKSDILIDLNLFNEDLLQKAKINARKNKTLLIDEVRKLSHVDDNELYRSIAEKNEIEFGEMDVLLKKADPSHFEACSKAFLDSHHLIPVYNDGDKLKIATYDPDASLDEIRTVFPRFELEKVLVTQTDFYRLWASLELSLEGAKASLLKSDVDTGEHDLLEKSLETIDAHLVSLFEAMLLDAVAERASDIHIEQYPKRVRVRLRVDGDLEDLPYYHISQKEILGLVNVIKLRANLNIAEKRLPQGGRSRLKVGDGLYDLRVQTQPSLHGENIVIRLLPQNSTLISIDKLGLSKQLTSSYKRLLKNPSGMVLVVGPTGSGKSTTLYAGLQVLAHDGTRKVITIEDPIEYSIDNIQQSQVKPEIDFHFKDAMRVFVREDPDVILVGEIRDTETALEAVRASQTGHLVLSTLHSNDAVDSLQRLYDLKIKPNSLAAELLAVIAQRLAKKVCTHCREEVEPDEVLIGELFPEGKPADFKCFEGKGCVHCNGQGTYGRIAIVEYMPVTPALRNAISQRPPIGELRRLAFENGLVSMRDSALDHVKAGDIPLSELPRIMLEERLSPENY